MAKTSAKSWPCKSFQPCSRALVLARMFADSHHCHRLLRSTGTSGIALVSSSTRLSTEYLEPRGSSKRSLKRIACLGKCSSQNSPACISFLCRLSMTRLSGSIPPECEALFGRAHPWTPLYAQ